MSEPQVPVRVQAFLREHVGSYEELAIVLLLSETPDRAWTPGDVAGALRLPDSVAEEALDGLASGLLVRAARSPAGTTYEFSPANDELRTLVAEMARAYAEHQLEIVRLMTANALERLRARTLSTFSDAFLVKRKRPRDG